MHLHDSSPELKVYTHLCDHSVSSTRHCVCGYDTWNIVHIPFARFSGWEHMRTSLNFNYGRDAFCYFLVFTPSLPFVVVALGIKATTLIPSLSETTQLMRSVQFLLGRVTLNSLFS